MEQSKKYHFKIVKILVLSITLVIALLIAENYFGRLFSIDQLTENSLRDFYWRQIQLQQEGKGAEIYDKFLSPDSKTKINRDEYIKNINDRSKNLKSNFKINSVSIYGNVGYIDRTETLCYLPECKEETEQRQYRKYIYDNNRWYFLPSDDPIYCIRDKPYNIPPEFERALSLIIQRYSESADNLSAKTYMSVRNCLNIQYANSDMQLQNAEGVFYFESGTTREKLNILVSLRYKIKDDLITAMLLAHELIHVHAYLSQLETGINIDCFEEEAMAFYNSYFFYYNLNKEEQASLLSRLASNPSEELKQFNQVLSDILKYPGITAEEQTLNYVKNQPFYQQQCAGR